MWSAIKWRAITWGMLVNNHHFCFNKILTFLLECMAVPIWWRHILSKSFQTDVNFYNHLYLLWSIILYKFLIYCFCFMNYLLRVFAFLEIFTGYPKFNVFLTEFSFKKSGKSLQSIYQEKKWYILTKKYWCWENMLLDIKVQPWMLVEEASSL